MDRAYTLRETEFLGMPLFEVYYPQNSARLEPQSGPITSLIVHHSGSQDYTIEKLIDFHMGKLEMGAIGYHFLINPEGQLLYTRDIQWKGAHAYPNTGKVGIGFLRSFDRKEPNARERDTFKKFVERFCGALNVPLRGHNQDQVQELYQRYPFISEHPELLRDLFFPSSPQQFNRNKSSLQRLGEEPLFYEAVDRLKTCPGINFYGSELMPHA